MDLVVLFLIETTMDALSVSHPQQDAFATELHHAMVLFQRALPSEFLEQYQPSSPQTVFTAWVTVWLMICQRLHPNASLETILSNFATSMKSFSSNKRVVEGTLSSNTGGISRARSRLKVEMAQRAADQVFQTLLPQTPGLIAGRRIVVVDGTTISLASNARLREKWPSAHNQHGPGPWPICLLAMMHELDTGMMLRPETGAAYGPHAQSEIMVALQMLPRIPEKSVLLADRNFGVFRFVYGATGAGHDVISRLTEVRFRSLQKKSMMVKPGVSKLQWKPTSEERRKYPELPAEAVVTMYLHEFEGYSKQTLWVATTLEIETPSLAAWYYRRGEVETDIRQSKKVLKLDELRGQSVEMIEKELAMHAIAYNLVVQVRNLASQRGQLPPKRLSFTGVWSLVECILLHRPDRTAEDWQETIEFVLRKCLQRKLPNRPRRSYPRQAYSIRRRYPIKKLGDSKVGKG